MTHNVRYPLLDEIFKHVYTKIPKKKNIKKG